MTKKKKKEKMKKNVPFDLNAAMGETEGAADGARPAGPEQMNAPKEVKESKPEKETGDGL